MNAAKTQQVTNVSHPFSTAPVVSIDELTRDRPIMVIAPHADDETLGCGGLIALAARAATPITAVLLTDGIRSHPGSRTYPPARLQALREAEFHEALDALGAGACRKMFFRASDGFLADIKDRQSIIEVLASEIKKLDIKTVFVTWGEDPHPDHTAAAALARELLDGFADVRGYFYPIWGLQLAPCALEAAAQRAVRLDIGGVADLKRAAVLAHRSQTTGLISDCETSFLLTPEDIGFFCTDHEVFLPIETATLQRFIQPSSSVPTAHFDRLYEQTVDPWGYETCAYEAEKFATTLELLPRRTYRRGFELGCSIGVLTASLARRCAALVAADCSAAAVMASRARLADNRHVVVEQMRAPEQLPAGTFDLIVLSEVLYLFGDADIQAIADFVEQRLEADGTCVLVNYLGNTLSPRSGDNAADTLIASVSATLLPIVSQRRPGFRVDVLTRSVHESVR